MAKLFAEVIRARRVELGLGRDDVAASVGVRGDTLAAWECGRRMPRPARITALATALSLDAEALLEVRHCANPETFSPEPSASFRARRGTVQGWGGAVHVRG